MSKYVQRVLDSLQRTNGNEKEFLQSVTEVLTSLGKMLDAQPKYEKNKMARMSAVAPAAGWSDAAGGSGDG